MSITGKTRLRILPSFLTSSPSPSGDAMLTPSACCQTGLCVGSISARVQLLESSLVPASCLVVLYEVEHGEEITTFTAITDNQHALRHDSKCYTSQNGCSQGSETASFVKIQEHVEHSQKSNFMENLYTCILII